jgi:aminobenzoyl-glutamate transport protein
MAPPSQRSYVQLFLDTVEKVGNRLPDPLTLFVIFCFIVIVLSALIAAMDVSVIHPADGRVIAAESLLSAKNIQRMFTEMVRNFALFPPLGMVLVTMIGIGVAERSGVISSALKQLVTIVPPVLLPATLVFAGIMSSMAADAGYVVLTPLGAVLFAGFGRHPLAGLAAAFAGVSGGFSANLLLTSLDPLLAGLSTTAAQTVDPAYTVHSAANYYFMIFSVFLVTATGTFVTTKIVEPRLGSWQPQEATGDDESHHGLGAVTPIERKGLWVAAVVFGLCSIGTFLLAFPENAVFA